MVLGLVSPAMEIVTLGGVAIAITAAIMYFVCIPKSEGRSDRNYDGTDCDHEHEWRTKVAAVDACPKAVQKIAHYGTLSISAQNSPTRHLRSISATNPPSHFLSPSHVRSPRRNSSPQQQVQIGPNSRLLHPHILELTSHPVQPPYWDAENQQYYYTYSHETCLPSPKRKLNSRAGNLRSASSASSTPTFSRKTSPNSNQSPSSGLYHSFGNTNIFNKRTTTKDYTNLFLPQAPNKQTLFDPYLSSSSPARICSGGANEMDSATSSPPSEKEDVLQVSQSADREFRLVLTKRMPVPTICKTPPEETRQDTNGNGSHHDTPLATMATASIDNSAFQTPAVNQQASVN